MHTTQSRKVRCRRIVSAALSILTLAAAACQVRDPVPLPATETEVPFIRAMTIEPESGTIYFTQPQVDGFGVWTLDRAASTMIRVAEGEFERIVYSEHHGAVLASGGARITTLEGDLIYEHNEAIFEFDVGPNGDLWILDTANVISHIVADGEVVATFESPEIALEDIAVADDGTVLVARFMFVWRVDASAGSLELIGGGSGTHINRLDLPAPVYLTDVELAMIANEHLTSAGNRFWISTTGAMIAISTDGVVDYDLTTRRGTGTLTLMTSGGAVAATPNGLWVAANLVGPGSSAAILEFSPPYGDEAPVVAGILE